MRLRTTPSCSDSVPMTTRPGASSASAASNRNRNRSVACGDIGSHTAFGAWPVTAQPVSKRTTG